MASKPKTILTGRDNEILDALIKTPLDAKQLLRMSVAFEKPFTDERLVRRRMGDLVELGLVSCFQYATIGVGSLNCYKVTRQGFRLRQGTDVPLPSRAFFQAVPLGIQEHTRALADFTATLHCSAAHNGVSVSGFYRENSLKLSIGDHSLQPDGAFQLTLQDGRTLNYLVEIDCGTEPLRATKNRESLIQKVRFYDEYHDQIAKRFIVLFLFTKPSSRMSNFIDLAAETIKDKKRALVYSGLLPYFLKQRNPLGNPAFLDKYHRTVSVLPEYATTKQGIDVPKKPSEMLVDVSTIW